jgi:hypothetical protein
MPRRVLLGLAALIGALAIAQSGTAASAGPAAAHRADRDQVKALRMTIDWLTTYSEDLWVGVELPGECRTLADGRRSCPIAISLRAWTHGELAPWRCQATALLPAPRSTDPPLRMSGHCRQLPAPS